MTSGGNGHFLMSLQILYHLEIDSYLGHIWENIIASAKLLLSSPFLYLFLCVFIFALKDPLGLSLYRVGN